VQSSLPNGHAQDAAAALPAALVDYSRIEGSPQQSHSPGAERLPSLLDSAGHLSSGVTAAVEGSIALSAGVAAVRLSDATAEDFARVDGEGGLDTAPAGMPADLSDVFENRGLCRGEQPAGPTLSVPVKSF
jgi:hypothetical protein